MTFELREIREDELPACLRTGAQIFILTASPVCYSPVDSF